MDNDLQKLQETALVEVQQANSKIALENVRVKFLGKAGAISRLSENMRNLPKEDRPRIGKLLNEIRNEVTAAIDSRLGAIESLGTAQILSDVDETLPGREFRVGGLHPLTLLKIRQSEFCDVWVLRWRMGPTLKRNGIVLTR
jgi:phenylalanyl-tRNA synthetase alpha chain